MGFTDYEEVQRNRRQKISKAKPPRKSKHKHVYEPCVLEYIYPYAECVGGQGFKSGRGARIDGYCPICGKVGPTDMTRWYKLDADVSNKRWGHKTELSDEAVRELDPDTRTLPTFDIGDDWLFPKFVALPEEEENLLSAPKEPLCPSMRR